MSSQRQTALTQFLVASGWSNAALSNLAGDASNRRYDRLEDPVHGRAVLMDAPPDKGEDTRPFIKIARHLRASGLSAPEIIASDTENGFLILEDLGDDLFARVLTDDPSLELKLYETAVEALVIVQNAKPPADLRPYGPAEMTETAMLATDWYLKYVKPDAPDIRAPFRKQISELLDTHLTAEPTLVQRDYHAENLLWLPDRTGAAKVGLLDFQDAMLGHPAYDLASLLKDARRDVSTPVQQACIAQFVDLTGADPNKFAAAYAICSAQRNLRIIGVFARLSIRDGKRHYPDMLPRVWRNLMDDLTHPVLQEFGSWVKGNFPEPTPELIAKLKSADV